MGFQDTMPTEKLVVYVVWLLGLPDQLKSKKNIGKNWKKCTKRWMTLICMSVALEKQVYVEVLLDPLLLVLSLIRYNKNHFNFWRQNSIFFFLQFRRLKFGDRFFYTHTNANGLSKVAKDQILQRTLGDVLCDVTRLSKVQTWVTLQPNTDYNPYKSCSTNRQLDVSF